MIADIPFDADQIAKINPTDKIPPLAVSEISLTIPPTILAVS